MPKKITLTFPDKSKSDFEAGITPGEVAAGISNSLRKKAVAAGFNDEIISLNTPLKEPGEIQIFTFKDAQGKEVFWHSSAHLMAHAIKRLLDKAF